jgi:aminopeptidase N
MLAGHLGQETFLKGVSSYLKTHAYGNAKTIDLWTALSKASGQDVPTLMNPWITKIGFPVLTVSEEPGQIRIKQTRYLSTGDVKLDEDSTTWWLGLGLEGKSSTTDVTPIAFTKKVDVIRGVDDSFYKINKDNTVCIFSPFPRIWMSSQAVAH